MKRTPIDPGDNVVALRPQRTPAIDDSATFPVEKQREVDALERRLVMAPSHAPTRERLRDLLFQRRDAELFARGPKADARRTADCFRLVELDPDCAEAWAARSREQTDDADRLADITRAIELDPECVDHRHSRASLHAIGKRYLLAVVDHQAAYELTGEWSDLKDLAHAWRQFDRLDDAWREFERAREIHGDHEPKVFEERARFLGHFRNDLAGAIAELDAGLERHRDNASLLFSRATAREGTGDLDGAESDFTRAIARDPGDAGYRRSRGSLRMRRGDLEGCLADFEASLTIDPDDTLARTERGVVLIKAGRYVEALKDFDAIVKRDRTDAETYMYRAVCHSRLEHRAKALADADRAVEHACDAFMPFTAGRAETLHFRSKLRRKYDQPGWRSDAAKARALGWRTPPAEK